MATPDGGEPRGLDTRNAIENPNTQIDNAPTTQQLRTDDDDARSAPESIRTGGADPNLASSVCPWRTEQHYDQECSRYHDCPGHILERHVEAEDGAGRAAHAADAAAAVEEGDTQEENSNNVDANVDEINHDDNDDGSGHESGGDEVGDDDDERQNDQGEDEVSESDAAAHTGSEDGESVLERRPSGSRGPSSQSSSFDLASQELSQRSTPRPERDLETISSASPQGMGYRSVPPRVQGYRTLIESIPDHAATSDASQARSPRSRPGEIILPRWQPDSEVTYCPICHTQFSIFVRKHHCRKCGRVVCNSCSPHRITIPYQYIVQPPGYSSMPTHRYPPLPGNEGYVDFNSLGGGERVRLCNPCVPDPNTAPPQTQDTSPRVHQRTSSNLLSPNQYPGAGSSRFGPYSTSQGGDPHARSRSVTMQSATSSSSQSSRGQYRGPPTFGGTPPAYFSSGSSSRNPNAPVPPSRFYDSYGRAGPSGAGPSSLVDRSLPPLPPPQPQIAEEDECPVCHRELPRRSLPNFEALREAHINICITAHSTYGSPSAASAGGQGDDGAPLPRIPPRTTRMFPYIATEKDCVDSAECSICLEEFEAGIPMARLECLCRFHRHCIAAWWERHPGRCPMHQHDSYGF